MPFCFFICTLLLLLFSGQAANALDVWSALENHQVIISHVDINILPVFNLQNPNENHFIGRWANFIHVETQENTIRPALLFKEGEPANAMQIHASERLLRNLPFVRDAEIIPLENPDGTVTAIVKVHDAWSLKLSLALRHVGGESEWSAKVKEYNILGMGKQIQIGYEKTLDRSFTDFAFQDPFLFNTRWIFFSEYKQLSDGTAYYGKIDHPFYNVQTPWAAGMAGNASTSIQTIYEKSEPVYNFDYYQYSYSLYYKFLVWKDDHTAQRLGLEGRATSYSYRALTLFQPDILPLFGNQECRYQGFLGFWQFFQDNYIARQNIEFMDKTEDINLGWDVQLRLGYFPRSLGSSRNAAYTEGSVTKGLAFDEHSFVTGNLVWYGFSETVGGNRLRWQSGVNFYDQHLPRQTLNFSFQFIHTFHPLPADLTYLGGSDGLRGYMNYFHVGNERWMFTLEDRVFTTWNILGLIKMGFVAYLDAGAIRELSTGHWSKPYASVGGGLRIGNLKSSFGRVISLTVATPLVKETGVEGIQFILGTGL